VPVEGREVFRSEGELPDGEVPIHELVEPGTRAPWNKRELEEPTPADALVVARALRMEGNRDARRLVAFAPKCRVIHPAKMARSII